MGDVTLVYLDEHFRCFAVNEPDARFQYEEIFRHEGYGSIDLPRRPFIVDVGANIGLFTILVKQNVADARVLAFEPIPEIAAALRRNLDLFQLDDVTIQPTALGPEREDAIFTYYPLMPGNSTKFPEQKELQRRVTASFEDPNYQNVKYDGTRLRVSVDRLSTFLTETQPVDLLKIDAEGGELEVLLGIDPPHWPAIRRVTMQVQDLDGRLRAVCDLLRQHDLEPSVGPSPLIPPAVRTYVVRAARR